ncbi:hypothetical protein ACFQFH_16400 [Halobaculum halobium]|uniref:DUF7093 family protein n=1 Tax=Halobaculum halobium TaxID=3032281 RepID=UPI003613547A
MKECSRCGETRVVSENKEVTSADRSRGDATSETVAESDRADGSAAIGGENAVDGTAADPTAADPTAPDPTAEEPVSADEPASADESVPADESIPADEPVSADESVPADEPVTAAESNATDDDGFDHPNAEPIDDDVDPDVEEDAEIIDADDAGDADGTTQGRGHGEWPDADANRRDDGAEGDRSEGDREPTEWPEAERPHSPAEGEDEDVEFIGVDDDAATEDAAANEARTDVIPDAKRADESGVAAEPADEDVEFIDGDGPGGWPEQAAEDEGYDAELGDDDAGVSVDGNLTPQVDTEVANEEDVEFIEADSDADAVAGGQSPGVGSGDAGGSAPGADDGTGSGGDDAGRSPSTVDLQTTVDRADTVYVCPDCGNNEAVGASSMRAGDICPECKRGYIEERERQ